MRSVFFVKCNGILLGVFLMLLFAGTEVFGKTVDEATARMVGLNFLVAKGVSVSGTSGLVVAYTAYGTVNGRSVASYYVFNVAGQPAFVMVSADDMIRPILAYSDESSFDITHISPATADWIDGYRNQITAAIANHVPAKSTTSIAWNELKEGAPSWKNARTTSVSPLLGSAILWDQGPYAGSDPGGFYNDSCPGTGANQALTGCVATAMAQVMKFWNWPTVGTGYCSYSCVTYSAVPFPLSADFGNTVYGWDSMQTPKETTHDPALAQLMFHAGVSVAMQYDTPSNGSAANTLEREAYPYTQCAEYALKTYFHYKRSLVGILRNGVGGVGADSIPEATWIAMLQTELNAGRPLIYDGYGAGGGHCWVCDGYETSSNMFHFNWGWSNEFNVDGYYSVDVLDPYGVSSPDNFNQDQGALFGIEPDSFPNTPGNIKLLAHLNSLTSTPMNYKTPFAVSTKLVNTGTASFTGDFAMQVFDTANNFVGTLQTYSGETIAAGDSVAYTFGPSTMYGMVPMDYYHIQAMYRPTGTATWTPIANNGTYINYTTADVINDTDVTLNENITVTSPLPVIPGAVLDLNTQLVNYGNLAFNGTVRAIMINVATGGAYVVDSLTGQSLLPDTSFTTVYTLNVSFTNSAFTAPDGFYALVIQHEYNGAGGFYTTGSTEHENPVIVQVGLHTATAATALNNDVYVFPNPASNQVTILPNGVGITEVTMFDVMGRQIEKQIRPNGKSAITVPVADLMPGVYFIRLRTDGQQTLTKKVIITK